MKSAPAGAAGALRVEFTRRADGTTSLRCVRADGSATWQNQRAAHALFFALHDITHYAVESELGFTKGFYGLIAGGWSIEETGGKGARGPLPVEAIIVEHLVGALDQERSSRDTWPASDFNSILARAATDRGAPPPAELNDAQLGRVRARIAELSARWAQLEPGAVMALDFRPSTTES